MGTSTFPYWLVLCFYKDSQSKALKHKLESSYPSFKHSPMISHPKVEENLLKLLVSSNTPHSSISLRISSAFLSLYPQLQSLPPKLLSISSIPLPTPSHSFCPLHLENSIPLSDTCGAFSITSTANIRYHFLWSWKLACVCLHQFEWKCTMGSWTSEANSLPLYYSNSLI